MADGLGNSGIAAKLKISGKTVSNYVTNILNKLQVADREEGNRIGKGITSRER